MGASALRFAPSGPFVKNAEGGLATPGAGFALRHAMLTATGLAPLSTSLNTSPLTGSNVSLDGVKTNLRYRIDLVLHAQKLVTWTATGTVAWTFEYSTNQSDWTSWGQTQTMTYGRMVADATDNICEFLRTTPKLGSTLTGVTAGQTLYVRVRGVLTGGVDSQFSFTGQVPSYVIDLIEEL